MFQQAILIGGGLGVLLGIYIARVSHRHESVRGGIVAHVFHYFGAAFFVSTLPTALTALIIGGGFGTALPAALLMIGLSLLSLMLFAVVELPHRPQAAPDEDAWTAEKARSSGL